MSPNLVATIIELGQKRKNDELKEVLEKTKSKYLIDLVVSNLQSIDGYTLWHYTLLGLGYSDACREKRFELIMAVLRHTNVVELSTKQIFDLIARLLTDLPTFSSDQLVEMCELCIEFIRVGDPKCLSWKHLLPQTLAQLNDSIGRFNANGMLLTGSDYRNKVLGELFKMKLQPAILTPLCAMFSDFTLSRDETATFVTKISDSIKQIEPLELPPLAFQLFHVCLKSPSQLIVPLMALEKYFHKNYYKKVLSTANSDTTDFDSIDRYSDNEIREAEETILYHLSNVTEFRLDETQTVAMFKPFQNNPEKLLTPFLVGALLAMSRINRLPDTTDVVSSPIMAFLIKLIALSEKEREMCNQSAWFRARIDSSIGSRVDQLFTVLTENSQEGKEVVTPGIIHFAFALLLAKKQPKLHGIAIQFFQIFLKRRFIFGSGIIAKLKKFLFGDLQETQFNLCLTTLSLTNTLTVAESSATIEFILEYLLLIDGMYAMRFMAFLFPLLRISHTIRDRFIEVLRKAMYNSESSTRIMGVFGFCSLLKQLKNNNARRSIMGSAGGNYTQLSISGMSLLSQAAYGSASNPNLHFDMLTLEIMGILRKCLTQTVEVRMMLYEALGRAVDFNTMLLPHALQFIDWHFESYFGENTDDKLIIAFDKCVRYCNDIEHEDQPDLLRPIVVYDNVGRLTAFMVHCIVLCDQHNIQHDTNAVKKTLQLIVDRVDSITSDELGIMGTLDTRAIVVASQYLNVIEAAMAYCAWKMNPDNGLSRDLLRLFKHHQQCVENFKKMEPKKGNKKHMPDNTMNSSGYHLSSVKHGISFKPENIWDIATVERMLRITFDISTNYAREDDLKTLRSKRDFQQHVLKTAGHMMETVRNLPDYWQVSHSKRTFSHLCECTKVVYVRCVRQTTELCGNGGLLVAQSAIECFRQSLISALELFERKFSEFLQLISCTIGLTFIMDLLKDMHTIIDQLFANESEAGTIGEKIVVGIFQCLELLYKSHIMHQDHLTLGYDWLQQFCVNTKLKPKPFAIVHRILFDLRSRTQSGAYFDSVAMRLELKFGQITEEELNPPFYLKSITSGTVDPTFHHLCAVVRLQLEEIEHLILRSNSLLARLKVLGLDDTDETTQLLKSIERSMCSQLVHILTTLTHLCNMHLPLGSAMDTLLKLLLSMYNCLANLSRHFLACHPIVPVSYEVTKFNLVVKATKPLASRIYDLFPFIEENILAQDEAQDDGEEAVGKRSVESSAKAKSNRDKVLRQTKFLPRLVFRIESYNKIVTQLSRKTKKDLTYLLHMGTVRDFRIKTSALKEAIEKTVTHGGDDDESNEEADLEPELDRDEGEDDIEASIDRSACSNRSEVMRAVPTGRASDISGEALALKNLARLNERTRKAAKKRAIQSVDDGEATDTAPKKLKSVKRKAAKSPKINKRVLEEVNRDTENRSALDPPAALSRTRTLGLPRRSARKSDA
ncbi:Fanconi anemia group I protein isoform X2 [Anopheles aquasalis]|uniref:Fanconi anemia group I protein isoform X2 n=1 Tax=Anopheles aquasalis TaxID=42839 RepID=UPI00215B73E2|nr:Fanconi anemia group I protein isoform X2 [Anopheles aquasalis]